MLKSDHYYEQKLPPYRKQNGELIVNPFYFRQTVPFFDDRSSVISRKDIFKKARDIDEPVLFVREMVCQSPLDKQTGIFSSSKICVYIKLFPETTFEDITYSALDFNIDPYYITYEICYKNHIANILLNKILSEMEAGNELCVSKLADLGGTVTSIFSTIKKIRERKAILHLFNPGKASIDFDFSPKNPDYDHSSKMLDFFLKIYSDNADSVVKSKKNIGSININDFSDDFLEFYFEYNKSKSDKSEKTGTRVKEYAKSVGVSSNTIYKRIAWLNAHPFEVVKRYSNMNFFNEANSYFSKASMSQSFYLGSLEEKKKTDFYRYVIDLSKKNIYLNRKSHITQYYIFYYKITSNTSLNDILEFCKYCNSFLYYEIKLDKIDDYYKIAKRIVWEYSYPSKEVNTKLYELINENFGASCLALVTHGFHDLSRSSTKLFRVMKRIFEFYSKIRTPELAIHKSDFEFLEEVFEKLPSSKECCNKIEKRGRPSLKKSDLPDQFIPLYNQYRSLKQKRQPLNGIIRKMSEECGVTQKTIYDWIHKMSSNALK